MTAMVRCRIAISASILLLLLTHPSRGQLLDPLDFVSLGTLNLASDNFTIDTDTLEIRDGSNTLLFTGVVDNQNGMASPGVIPEIAVFTFAGIDLASTANFTITGTRALALLSHSDIVIDTTLRLNGGGTGSPCGDSCAGGDGGPGGFAGGLGFVTGSGPGGGGGSEHTFFSNAFSGAGGGYGSAGQAGYATGTEGVAGPANGNLAMALQGGSGGGGSRSTLLPTRLSGGGGGGGALEIGAPGAVTIGINGVLEANGGVGDDTAVGFALAFGGNGSGGGIRIHGGSLTRLGAIRALGGNAPPAGDQAAGGGGRVLLAEESNTYTLGSFSIPDAIQTVDVSPGLRQNAGDLLNHGSILVSPALTVVPFGQPFELGASFVAQTASQTQPQVEVRPRSLQITGSGEVTVPSGGHTNQHQIELRSVLAKITGTGVDTLTNQGVLRGTGRIEVPVVNGGEISGVNDTLAFTQAVTSNAGAQINAINSTMSFDAGLTNNGDLNLINSTVTGALTVVESPIVAVGENTLTNGVLGPGGHLIKRGAGTLTLTGSGHAYSGETRVEEGTLRLHDIGPNVRLPDATIVNVSSGATLRYEIGTADAIFGLNGLGNVELIDSFLVLGNLGGVGTTGGVGTFNGTLSGDATSLLEKRGSGTFTFAGTGNYGGKTEVENGQFLLTGTIDGTSNVDVIDGPLAGGGTLTIDSGSLSTIGTTTVGAGGTLNLMDGQLTTPVLAMTGAFNMTGGLLVADTISGHLSQSGGTFAPGTNASGVGPGLTLLSSSYDQQAAATLEIEIGGTLPGDNYDSLLITGTASLAGVLELRLINGFVPTTDDTFTILQAMEVMGSFANAGNGQRVDLQDGGGSLLISYSSTIDEVVLTGYRTTLECDFDFDGNCDGADIDRLVTEIVAGTDGPSFDLTGDGQVTRADINDANNGWLRVAGEHHMGPGMSFLEGDVDLDGTVDADDFETWNANKFTASSKWTEADFDASGFVDGRDFLIWNANKFSLADLSSVPEPRGIVLLLIALASYCSGSSARQSH